MVTATKRLTTQREAHSHSAAYYGDRPDWGIALSTHRDDDCIGRANWEAAQSELTALNTPDDWATEESSHWAVGWVRYLLVRPGSTAESAALKMQERMADYPLLDEEIHSRIEFEEVARTIREAVTYYCHQNDVEDIDNAIAKVSEAAFNAEDSNSPYHSGVEDYWPKDEFIAQTLAT